jgi:hypothetical protein
MALSSWQHGLSHADMMAVQDSMASTVSGAWMQCRCLDTGQEAFKSVHPFNEKLLHLVGNVFWCMSFRSTEHAKKVQSSIFTLINVIVLIVIVLGPHC